MTTDGATRLSSPLHVDTAAVWSATVFSTGGHPAYFAANLYNYRPFHYPPPVDAGDGSTALHTPTALHTQ